MDVLTIVMVVLALLVGAGVALLLARQGGGREAEAVRQQLALAISQQADTVQRVERSLREQEDRKSTRLNSSH